MLISGPFGDRCGAADDRRVRHTRRRRGRAERLLIRLELLIGGSALAGGLALVARPDGSLLQAKLSALRATPFADWRIPGALLAGCVGGGSLLAALALLRRDRYARDLALLVSTGVIAFELVEWRTIGFQPLEAVVGALAALMLLLARRVPAAAARTVRREEPRV